MEQREFIVEQETAGQRIDRFLSGEDTGLSRSALQALVAEGHVQCNGKTVAKSLKLKAGDTVLLEIPDAKPIEAGSDFREFIAEKIRDSWQVLLFASHESIQPGFVRNEINYALHCGKPILRVNLDDVELTPGMELSLGGMQYVDATEPDGDYLERIVRTLLAERKEKA